MSLICLEEPRKKKPVNLQIIVFNRTLMRFSKHSVENQTSCLFEKNNVNLEEKSFINGGALLNR